MINVRGVTLVETIASLALLSILAVCAVGVMSSLQQANERSLHRSMWHWSARVVLQRIHDDVAGAQHRDGRAPLQGDAEHLTVLAYDTSGAPRGVVPVERTYRRDERSRSVVMNERGGHPEVVLLANVEHFSVLHEPPFVFITIKAIDGAVVRRRMRKP